MSFIEGHLSVSPQGEKAFVKRWCKVDGSQFAWSEDEDSEQPLGFLSIAKGGTVVQLADETGSHRFNLYADNKVLECSALSDAELEGWLDFIINETPIIKADKPPVKVVKKVTDKEIAQILIDEAVQAEQFEKCVQYRQYRKLVDDIGQAIAAEEFEKCVELRNKKKQIEAQLPEIGAKRKELSQGDAAPPAKSNGTTAAAAAPVVVAAKPSADLDAIKSRLFGGGAFGPAKVSSNVSALLDAPTGGAAHTRGRERTQVTPGTTPQKGALTFKAWKSGEASNSDDTDSQSLVRGGGGGVTFGDMPVSKKKRRGPKQDYSMRTTWSGGGNMLQQAQQRAEDKAARKAERAAAKQAALKKAAAEKAAAERATRVLLDREREAKWAKLAPKKADGDKPNIRTSWDGGRKLIDTLASAVAGGDESTTEEEEQVVEESRDDRITLDSEDSGALQLKKKKPKKKRKKGKKSKKAKQRALMRSTWGGGGNLTALVPREKPRKKKAKQRNTDVTFYDEANPAPAGASGSGASTPKKGALKQKSDADSYSGFTRAADAGDTPTQARAIVNKIAVTAAAMPAPAAATEAEAQPAKSKGGFFSKFKKNKSKAKK